MSARGKLSNSPHTGRPPPRCLPPLGEQVLAATPAQLDDGAAHAAENKLRSLIVELFGRLPVRLLARLELPRNRQMRKMRKLICPSICLSCCRSPSCPKRWFHN